MKLFFIDDSGTCILVLILSVVRNRRVYCGEKLSRDMVQCRHNYYSSIQSHPFESQVQMKRRCLSRNRAHSFGTCSQTGPYFFDYNVL